MGRYDFSGLKRSELKAAIKRAAHMTINIALREGATSTLDLADMMVMLGAPESPHWHALRRCVRDIVRVEGFPPGIPPTPASVTAKDMAEYIVEKAQTHGRANTLFRFLGFIEHYGYENLHNWRKIEREIHDAPRPWGNRWM